MVPIVTYTETAPKPTMSDVRAPLASRASTSRPD